MMCLEKDDSYCEICNLPFVECTCYEDDEEENGDNDY